VEFALMSVLKLANFLLSKTFYEGSYRH